MGEVNYSIVPSANSNIQRQWRDNEGNWHFGDPDPNLIASSSYGPPSDNNNNSWGFWNNFFNSGDDAGSANNWFMKALSAPANALKGIGDGVGTLFGFGGGNGGSNWWTTPMGTGKNAITPLELGTGIGLTLFGAYQQKKALDKQLAFGREQLAQNKAFAQTNWMDQAQNRAEQTAMQLQGLQGWDPNAARQRANDLQGLTAGLDRAGANIGIANASTLSGFSGLLNNYKNEYKLG
jgi:hypothetical protein